MTAHREFTALPPIQLDADMEIELDAVTRAAAAAAAAPLAMLVIDAGERLEFPSVCGFFGLSEAGPEAGFPDGPVEGPFTIADAYEDEFLGTHPFVTGAPFARAVAQYPVRHSDGTRVGSLLVLDPAARNFGVGQRRALEALARVAGSIFDSRRHAHEVARIRQVVDTACDEVFLFNPVTGTITFANAKAAAGMECRPDELVGRSMDVISQAYGQEAANGLDESPRAFYTRHVRADGSHYPVEASVRAFAGDGTPAVLVIAENHERRRKMETPRVRVADRDAVTGVATREAFDQTLPESMVRAQSGGPLMALLTVQIDRHQQFRALHGNGAGDELLQVFASRLRRCVRPFDTISRIGAGTFALVLEDIGQPCYAEMVATRVATMMAQPFAIAEKVHAIGSFLSVRMYAGEPVSPEAFVEAAEAELEQAACAVRGVPKGPPLPVLRTV